jgi:hypothetical protein
MRSRRTDVDTDTGQMRMRSHRAFVVMAMIAMAAMFMSSDGHRISC